MTLKEMIHKNETKESQEVRKQMYKSTMVKKENIENIYLLETISLKTLEN